MDKQYILEIYREQFAFEVDRKKNITTQAQIRFALIAAGSTMLIYMIRNVDLNAPLPILAFFAAFILISSIIFTLAVYKLSNAFWGNEYTYLPPMDATEKYRIALESAANVENNDFETYLLEEYSQCAGDNRKTNQKRQKILNSLVKLLHISIIPFVLASGIFLTFDLDASSSRKTTEVKIINAEQLTCLTKNNLKGQND